MSMSAKGLRVGYMYKLTLRDGKVVEGKLIHVQKTMFGDMLLSVTIGDTVCGATSIVSLELIGK